MSCTLDQVDKRLNIPSKFRDMIYLPFRFKTLQPLKTNDYNRFHGELYKVQKEIFDQVTKCFSEGRTGIMLELPTGFGKTLLTLYIISRFLHKEKTLILVPRIFLKKQWEDTIDKFVPEMKDDFIIHCFASHKKLSENRTEYKAIVLDEVHTYCDLTFTKVLYNYSPSILIGLTATPRIEFEDYKYFFMRAINYKSCKYFKAFVVFLDFVPEERYIFRYKKRIIDYSFLLNSLMLEERFEKIANIIKAYYDTFQRRTLVLTKRIKSVDSIMKYIKNMNLPIDYIHSNKNEYSDDAVIIIGTYDKIGLGLNDPSFSMLVVLDNVKDVRQAEGRIRQDQFIIVDIVDNHGIFRNHWNIRKIWYQQRGGVIIEP